MTSTKRPTALRAARLGTSSLYPLYIRLDRQTERDIPHARRLMTGPTPPPSIFDLRDEDVFWCTADIGWVTGHSYVVYGPLSNGATTTDVLKAPRTGRSRIASGISSERHRVSIFSYGPHRNPLLHALGTRKHDLSSLPSARWVSRSTRRRGSGYHATIGGNRCPIVDTWWQTETGGIMISPLPGVTTLRPGSASRPFPGIAAEIRNEKGETVEVGGFLALTRPWPSMLRGI